jgi:restriction endonuclease Mrr
LLGAVFAYEAAKGLLICTSDFTDSARGFAERHSDKILLWTTGDLEQFAKGQLSV